jgi:hypothetical protein
MKNGNYDEKRSKVASAKDEDEAVIARLLQTFVVSVASADQRETYDIKRVVRLNHTSPF